jgi:hypothetical protein
MHYQSQLIKAVFDNTEHSQNALSVYQNNYIESGIRALSITYASVFAIMNEADFRKLSIEYLTAYPKTCFDWADYGQNLSEFMLSIEAIASMPFLPELADIDRRLMQLERASNQSFNAASFALLHTQALDTLCFVPAPGLQLTQTLFPIVELYELAHAFNNENGSRDQAGQKNTHANSVKVLINAAIDKPRYKSIVLWREHYKGLFEYCDTPCANAFSSILNYSSISDVLGHFGDDQNTMTKWLAQHIRSRKIYAITQKT